jgi:hypothetical protein
MNLILRRTLVAVAPLALIGCVQAPKQLYMWELFPRQQYDVLHREGVSPESQIQALEAHAEKARAANAALPPGFRAHLGMMHLSTGNVTAARQMFQAEKVAFPESAAYMDSLLKRMDGETRPRTAVTENPA